MLAERVYKEWAKKDLWTVEEAIKLTIGHDPEFLLNGQHRFDELYLGQFENNFDEICESRSEKYHSIEEIIRLTLHAKLLEFIPKSGCTLDFSSYNNEFDEDGIRVEAVWADKASIVPKKFIEWAKQKCIHITEKLTILFDSNSQPLSVPEYISPYIRLMLSASETLNITEDKMPKHEYLQEWLRDNQPDGLNLSKQHLKSMATLTRSPKSAIGGNKKQSNKQQH